MKHDQHQIKNHNILFWSNNTFTRKEEVVTNYLKIGHIKVIHDYLIKKYNPLQYAQLVILLMIKLILTECRNYKLQYIKYKLTHHLSENLCSGTTNTLKFLKYIYFVQKSRTLFIYIMFSFN